MKNLEKKLWEIAEFGPKTTMVLFIAGLILIFGFRDKLGWQILGVVLLIFSSGESGKRLQKRRMEKGKEMSKQKSLQN